MWRFGRRYQKNKSKSITMVYKENSSKAKKEVGNSH